MSTSVREDFIPFGDAGSFATVAHMRNVISEAIRSPIVVETAHRIAMQFPVRAYVRVAIGIRDWMKENFFFVRDPVGVELIRTPEYLLNRMQITGKITGDCDDATVLGCALGKAIGIPCKIVTIGFNRAGTSQSPLSHVFGMLVAPSVPRAIAIELDVTKPANSTASVRRRLEFPA